MKQDSTEEKTKEQLIKEEAGEYYNIAKDYRRERYMKDEQEAYILSKVWLNKWKKYVNYTNVKRNIQYSYYYSQHSGNKKFDFNEDSHPGEIDNNVILVPLTDFLNDGDESNPENQVIRHDINQKGEIKIVNKAIWELFVNKYGGGPVIKKGTIEEKSRFSSIGKKIIEIYYRKVT